MRKRKRMNIKKMQISDKTLSAGASVVECDGRSMALANLTK